MKRAILLSAALLCTLAGAAPAAEFQPLDALGIGGAGVARQHDAYAPYWNPAGLAFSDKGFSSRLSAGAGIRVNSTMAENIDRIGNLDINELRDLNISTGNTPAQNLSLANKAVQFVGIINDLEHNDGTLTVNATAALGLRYGRLAVGGFSTMELASLPTPDTLNVRPGGTTTVADFATGIGAATATYPANRFFSDSQRAAITAAFGGNEGITRAIETSFASPGGNATSLTPEQAKDALIHMGQALTTGQGSLENNLSTLEHTGLIVNDFPIAYGIPLDLGSFGRLGLGASLKVIWGRAFIGESQVVKLKDSGDIVRNITERYQDTTTVGIDLGALWQLGDWLAAGIVAKNLNSPEFDTPAITTISGTTRQATLRVKPQVRTGVEVVPLPWLAVAADLDLTENETILPGRLSRNLGGGVELRPLSWFKLRGGAYKNLAAGEIGPVVTAGLTLGGKGVNLDIDGATSLETGRYKDHEYPREARLQLQLNLLF